MTTQFRRHIEWSATQDYEYSKNDCMTFPMQWHDIRFGTDKAKALEGKYRNDYTCKKFYKNFIRPTTWLSSNGYSEVKRGAEDHDIWVVEHEGGWTTIWVWFEGHLYFRDHKKLIKVLPKSVKATSKWRR